MWYSIIYCCIGCLNLMSLNCNNGSQPKKTTLPNYWEFKDCFRCRLSYSAMTVKYIFGGFSVAERNIKHVLYYNWCYHRTVAPLSPSDPLLPLLKHQHTVPVEVSSVEVSVGRHRHTLHHQQVSKPLLNEASLAKYNYSQTKCAYYSCTVVCNSVLDIGTTARTE